MSRVWVPRRYQANMLEFGLETDYCAWLVDMGLGKTVAAATLIQRSLYDLFDTKRWLIVGPKRVATKGWPDELAAWLHLRNVPYRVLRAEDFGLTPTFDQADVFDPVTGDISEAMKRRGLAFGWSATDPKAAEREAKRFAKKRIMAMREHVHIVSYDFLPWLAKALGTSAFYDGLVLDESSMFKNQDTLRFRSIRHLRQYAKRCVLLTGTPSPRSLLDLWAQFYIVDEGERLLPTYSAFRDLYFTPDKRGGPGGQTVFSWKPDRDARERIYEAIGDVAMSLRSEDYLELPPLIDNPIRVELPPAARELYATVERDLVAVIQGSKVVASTAAILGNKLLQIANGCVFDEGKKPVIVHDAKLDALAELVESTPGNLLLAYGYRHDADRIQKRFGRIARKLETDDDLDDWNKGKVKLGYGHPASFGHGLNLQLGGSNAVFYGPTYSLEHWQQFIKRLHRSGQIDDRVTVHTILAEDTLDDHVRYQVIEAKETEQTALMQAIQARVRTSEKLAA